MVKSLVVMLALSVFGSFSLADGVATSSVYKSPYCGCCGKWIEHMHDNGFDLAVNDTNELHKIKAELGIPAELQSCHTAKIGNYFIEGHVPAAVVRRLLTEANADIVGIAAPGMPAGANVPGMEVSDKRTEYTIYAQTKSGETIVYETVK